MAEEKKTEKDTPVDLTKVLERVAKLEEALVTERNANRRAQAEIATLKNVDPRSEIKVDKRYCNACGKSLQPSETCAQHPTESIVHQGWDPILRKDVVLRRS